MHEFVEFHFLRPYWLVGILILIPALYTIRQRTVRANKWKDAIDPELLSVLISPSDVRSNLIKLTLATIGFVLAFIALSGPTWERKPSPVERQNDPLVVILDLSLSMYVQDITPSRIERAKYKIADILAQRAEGFTGLIVYAGDGHVVTPLTDDVGTVNNLLTALHPGMMPIHGSKPQSAVELARELFTNSGFQQGRILLITDGIDRVSEIVDLAHPDYPISILGVGTIEGGYFPKTISDEILQVLQTDVSDAKPQLDEARLTSLSQSLYGKYHTLSADSADLEYLLSTNMLIRDDTTPIEREFDTWSDIGYWLIVPIFFLALALFRKGSIAVIVLSIGYPADADWWADLWWSRDQQAYRELKAGQIENASQLFEDSKWRGVTKYREEDFGSAIDLFNLDASPTGNYNLGNALAKDQRYEEAIAAYQRTLNQEPQHDDAIHNKALVEELLKEQQEQQQNSSSESQDENQESGSDRQESESNSTQESEETASKTDTENASEENTNETESSNTDDQNTTADSEAEERSDANEQLLRKIPDNPGGLLRNKFKHETNVRLQNGELRRNARDKIW